MIFVTGGTGLLGNSIIRELLQSGASVRALCRAGTDRRPLSDLEVEIVEGDLSNAEALKRGVSGCEAVIHAAAYIHIGWSKLQQSREVNVEGTQRIVDLCSAEGCRFIHISTVDTLPAATDIDHPIGESSTGGVTKTACSYVVSKTEAEAVVTSAVESERLDAAILHPGFMLGPYDWKPSSGRMMLEITRAPILAAPSGGCSLCDGRDVAAAAVRAVTDAESGEHYILAGHNLNYRELWQQMLRVAGKPRHILRLGPAMRFVGLAIDSAGKLLPLQEGDVNGAAIAMGGLNHYYNSQKAQHALGYSIRPAEQTLADAWNWLQRFTR